MLNPYQQVGRKIQLIRRREGLTQAQLAEKSDISGNYIGLIERGVGHPTLETLSQIADALKIKIGELFAEEKNKQSKEQAIKEIGQVLLKRQDNDAQLLLAICKAIRSHYPTKGER